MKIRISDIPANGLMITDTLGLEPLAKRMSEGRTADIVFTSPPDVTLKIDKTPSGAQVSGWVKSKVKQACSLCAIEVERELDVEIRYALQQVHPKDSKGHPELLDDIGIVFFEGEHVDLENTLQEALILELSLFWHPDCNDEGCCKHCGKLCEKAESDSEAPNNTVSLGELFKKAGLN